MCECVAQCLNYFCGYHNHDRLHPNSLPLLVSAHHYLSAMAASDAAVLSSDVLKELLPSLAPSLSSPHSPVRAAVAVVFSSENSLVSPFRFDC